jgi:uncharacterized membrane protein
MICTYCAAEMPEVSEYCPECGRSVGHAGAQLQPANLAEAVLGALAYIGVLPAIVMLAIPAVRERRFVRFHCWQALIFVGATVVIALAVKIFFMLFSAMPGIGFLVSWLLLGVVVIAIAVCWLALVVKALQGETYGLPYLGKIAERFTG